MARLLPFRTSPEIDRDPRLVNLDDETADEVFAALSSDTARAILGRLYEDPATASDVAESVDTSLQNARYHLDKLQAAGLIEQVDTWYSSRGTEMTVYAPTNEPLVVAAGREEQTGALKKALTRVLGGVGALAVASAVIDRVVRRFGAGPWTRAAFEGRDRGADTEMEAAEATTAAPEGDGGNGGGAGAADADADADAVDAGGTEAARDAARSPSQTTPEPPTETATPPPAEAGTPTEVPTRTEAATPSAAVETPAKATETSAPAATGTPSGTAVGTPEATPGVAEATVETATPAPTPTHTPTPPPTATPAAAETEAEVAATRVVTRVVEATPEAKTVVVERTVVRTVRAARAPRDVGPAEAVTGLPPGLLFFAGGLLVLLAAAGWWYWSRYRPLYG